jgi:hypothetical protein
MLSNANLSINSSIAITASKSFLSKINKNTTKNVSGSLLLAVLYAIKKWIVN